MQQLSKTGIDEPEVFKGAARATGPRELRLALSLRGGVSLAVWIGGAVAELDRLRRAARLSESDPRDGVEGVFKKLCDFANYDNVSIDVITGASAGGLNGVLYTASLVYGFAFDKIAGVWVRWTDIETLTRETSGFVDEQARSLLDGDGYFLRLVETELTRLVHEGTGQTALDERDPRLELLLTATLADPVEVRFSIDRFADIIDSRRGAYFRFSHLGKVGGPFSYFGAPNSSAQTTSVSQLALAARASSSFPVAFEPASVGGDGVEIQRMFSEDLAESVEVIDGGTLDNIPVTKAIDAIAAAPAQGPTERWLVYLHPSPEVGTPEETPPLSRTDGLRTIIGNMKRAANAAISQESLIDDLVELERHNVAVADQQASRNALIGSAITAGFSPGQILDADGDWVKDATHNWLAVEAGRVMHLAERPREAAINHSITSTPIPDRWQTGDYRLLRRRLFDALESATTTSGDRPCLPDLIAITSTLLGWANNLQRVDLETSELNSTKLAKRKLYKLRLLLDTLTAVWEGAWIKNTGGERPPLDLLSERIREWHEQALSRSEYVEPEKWQLVLDAIAAALPASTGSENADVDFHGSLQTLVNSAADERTDLVRICDPLWDLLAQVAEDLDEVTEGVHAEEFPVDVQWIRRGNATKESLQALSVLLAPQVSRTAVSFSRIDFARLSGANETALDYFFGSGGLTVDKKLVGNELANFGAFFTAKGRANDWMWGRLDAAKTIVDVVLAGWQPPPGLIGDAQASAVDDAVGQLRTIVTHPFAGDGDMSRWSAWSTERWTANEPIIREEVQAQFEDQADGELEVTTRVLTERIQAEILAFHAPWVKSIDAAVESRDIEVEHPVADPVALQELSEIAFSSSRDFAIPDSIGPIRWASIGMRLGLVGWRAFTGRVWGLVLFALKPAYLYLLAIAVQPRRALFSGMIGFGALTVGDWRSEPMTVDALWTLTDGDPERSWQRLIALLMVYVSIAILIYLEIRRRKREVKRTPDRGRRDFHIGLRLAAALSIVLVATTSMWPGWVAPPVVVVVAGFVVAALLFGFMRPMLHRLGVVLVVATYVLWAWLAPTEMTRGWWAFIGYATVTYGLTFAVSLWDVFKQPPSPFD